MPFKPNQAFDVSIDKENVIINITAEGASRTVKRPIKTTRDYILSNYNWNGVFKLMRFLYQEHEETFDLEESKLTGTEKDDFLLIPDRAVAFALCLQLESALKKLSLKKRNLQSILKKADGKPGPGFCASILKKDRLVFLNESLNKNLKDPDTGKKLKAPLRDAAPSEYYHYFKKIVKLRNGVWSERKGVVNLIGLRRVIVKRRSSDAGYNDTIASCWIDKNGNEQCEINIATTEPGNRQKARELFPQTMTLIPGYHKKRQPGGRTRNALKEGSSRNINLRKDLRFNDLKPEWCSGDTTMNFHQGGNNFLYPSRPGLTDAQAKVDRSIWLSNFGLTGKMQHGLPSTKADREALFDLNLVLSEIYLILSRYGEDRKNAPYKNLKNMLDHPKISRSKIKNGKITVRQSGSADKIIDVNNVKGRTLRIWFDKRRSAASKKKIYEILEHISDYTPEEIKSWRNFSMSQVLEKIKDKHIVRIIDIQIDYLTRISKGVDGIAGNDFYAMISGIWQKISDAKRDKARIDQLLDRLDALPLNKSLKNMFKKSMRIRTYSNRISVRDNTKYIAAKDLDLVAGVVVGSYSAGCQVFFDTEVFYTFWTNLLKRAKQSGQRRWYYTLVDATDFKKSDIF